jgi:hypothetical protein
MAILVKGKTFTGTEQVTSPKLHQLIDSGTFDTGAVDGVTTALSGGAIVVKDGGITGAKLSLTVAIPTGATAVTQAVDTNTTAVATTAFAKKEADDAQAAAIAASCQRASNLSDVASASTARTNLGLGTAATQSSSQVCKAWALFNGTLTGSNAPTASYNVSSVTRNSAGNYTVVFSSGLSSANYSAIGNAGGSGAGSGNYINTTSRTTAQFVVQCVVRGISGGDDASEISVAVFGA